MVLTGPSGSGKSSLAFDTLYAEAQRRFIESLSAYSRQFLEQLPRPEVDSIRGLSPAIALKQSAGSGNPRSTVGTMTEIFDYLRLLYARTGTPWCERFEREIATHSAESMADEVLLLPQNSKVQLLAPLSSTSKPRDLTKKLEELRKAGFVRLRVDGSMTLIEDLVELKAAQLEVVYDRLTLKQGVSQRLQEGIEATLKLSGGELLVLYQTPDAQRGTLLLREGFRCGDCGIRFPKLEPNLFSFNSPRGACPECLGLGTLKRLKLDAVVPDQTLSLKEGAILPWKSKRPGNASYRRKLTSFVKRQKINPELPWHTLPEDFRSRVLYGDEKFEGVFSFLKRRLVDAKQTREHYESFLDEVVCESCKGTRLCQQARMVRVAGKTILELLSMNLEELHDFIEQIPKTTISSPILTEVSSRLGYLKAMGLDYLSLDRPADTLSGGETQRIRLGAQIGSGLSGVLYVLDEPSSGLHASDNKRLLDTLKSLRDLGNTVLIVEHDQQIIEEADYCVELGPGAGDNGGLLTYQGPPKSSASRIARSVKRKASHYLHLQGASLHNLDNLDLRLPLQCLVSVSGVSGSGKSSLLLETLYPALSNLLYPQSRKTVGPFVSLSGTAAIEKVICVDQNPLGRTPRSNAATYSGIFDHIRELFSGVEEARLRGWGPGRFSFNVKGGRCETCQGAGVVKVDMQFLPPAFTTCERCEGKRYNRETLEVRYQNLSIFDVLELRVEEALKIFERIPPLFDKLKALDDVGLGYLQLGQSATTLSGGEAQRVKLAAELARKQSGKSIYILDEPTSGLSNQDVAILLEVLQRLVDKGNTVVVIEHHLDVIANSDWVIDLGPGAGAKGGRIVAEGPPKEVAKVPASLTGQVLAEWFTRSDSALS